jgi:hypothetical protein
LPTTVQYIPYASSMGFRIKSIHKDADDDILILFFISNYFPESVNESMVKICWKMWKPIIAFYWGCEKTAKVWAQGHFFQIHF